MSKDVEKAPEKIPPFAPCRRGQPDESLLDDAQRADLALMRRVAPYQLRGNSFPTYATSNLSGNIKRNRDRLENLRVRASVTPAEPAAEDSPESVFSSEVQPWLVCAKCQKAKAAR